MSWPSKKKTAPGRSVKNLPELLQHIAAGHWLYLYGRAFHPRPEESKSAIDRGERASCDEHRNCRYSLGEQDYRQRCTVCDATPTVHPTGLCGPCCFGEAETYGGNW